MISEQDYRPGLSARDLVSTLRSLLAAERTAMRLTCRYLADLADCMEAAAVAPFSPDGATIVLMGYADIYHAAQCLFGLGAHGTRERIRVGKALRSLPRIEGALLSGEVSYSRAREVTRVATPDNESTWLDLARTLPMRHLERRVVQAAGTGKDLSAGGAQSEPGATSKDLSAGGAHSEPWATGKDLSAGGAHSEPWATGKDLLAGSPPSQSEDGDNFPGVTPATGKAAPGRAADPAQMRWTTPETVEVKLRLPAEAWALLQRAMEGARRASETSLSDAEALAAVARDALDQQSAGADSTDPRNTVVLYECQSCHRTEVDTGAGPLEIGAGAAATLGCGARVRDLRAEGRIVRRGGPLPKAIERTVRLRDRNTCRVPGCHRRRYVDVHHIDPRSEGGAHSRVNCVCLCTTHHARLHEGRLRIEGDADGELIFFDAKGAPLTGPMASRAGTAVAPAASQRGTDTAPVVPRFGMDGPALDRTRALDVERTARAAAPGIPSQRGTAAASLRGKAAAMGLGEEAATLLALIGRRGGWTVDALVEASGLRVSAVQSALLGLELDGRVSSNGFGSYAPCG